jgi:hypothetical protein
MEGNMNNTSSPLKAFKRAPSLEASKCVFLPKFKPHAFIIRSPRLRVLALFTPGGLEEAFRGMSSPAQSLDHRQAFG